MKLLNKVILIGALITSIISTGIAQQIDFNVKGGVTYAGGQSEITNDGVFLQDIDISSQLGFYVGGLATFQTKVSKLKFQTELFYQLNRIAFLSGESCFHGVSFHQITAPVLAKYQLAKNLNLTGGAYISVNLKVKNHNRHDYTKTDLGALFGLEYPLQNGTLLDLRYNYGLTNMIHDDSNPSRITTSHYNRTLTFGIVYLL